jgi:hypothetical protein
MLSAMTKLEREAVECLEDLLGALGRARGELIRSEEAISEVLGRVGNGECLASIIAESRPSELLGSVESAMEAAATCRHRTRSVLFSLAQQNGTSISDLGRRWGISRQLASRYAQHASNGKI